MIKTMIIRWPAVNLFCTIVSLIGIYVISSGVTGLSRVNEVSKKTEFTNLTLPPGFIFSIWGVIYLGFAMFALYQMFPKASQDSKFSRSRVLITLSMVLNLAWILLVGFGYFIAPYILQWLMMIVSIRILFLIRTNTNLFRSIYEKILFQTFVLYAGWLTVAMIPYTTDILLSLNWNGEPMTREFWAVAMYCIAACIVYFAVRSLRYSLFIIPLAWALFGLCLKFEGTVSITAGVVSIILLIIFILNVIRVSKHLPKDYVE